MELICYRDIELARETRLLRASTYNATRLLLEQCGEEACFIAIRSMQYLAIIDHEEIIFLDSAHKSWVDIAWQNFHPQQRNGLNEPVPYEAAYYTPSAAETMKRLQFEFELALQKASEKQKPGGVSRILKFDRKNPYPKS